VLKRKIETCDKEGLSTELALRSFSEKLDELHADTESHLNEPIEVGEY